MNPNKRKYKGILKCSFEALAKLLMISPNINVDNVTVDDSCETVSLKLSSSQEEKHYETNSVLTKEVTEGSIIETTLKITERDVVHLLTEQLKTLSCTANNKEFLTTILTLTNSRPNLNEYISKQIMLPEDERDNIL